ncbi:hypothetical protein [Sporosarcina sp. JAI121]|uniref:hypothetical protein n=1 Tax=Sporosarcina sp. JAI121 TaxID=2723064 RepID=UPI0015C99C5B|nr:hypothetical protein [Sporosarcina sp. JAI121]NYF23765.1 hypothetical protein [Sporosarcina sp. JAI121]
MNDVVVMEQGSGGATKPNIQPNETIEKIKVAARLYWDYFVTYLKSPSNVIEREEKNAMNGIVTIVIMAIFIGLSFFTLLKRMAFSFLAYSYEPSFFSVIGSSILSIFIITAIVIGSLFLTVKFLGPDHSLTSLVGIYGTHLIPSTFLALIALLLLVIKAYVFGNFLLSFALLLAFLVVPLFILTKLVKQEALTLDPLYCVIVYVVIFGIAFSIFLMFLGDSMTGGIISQLDAF